MSMIAELFGLEPAPQWKTYLNVAPNYVIEETGLSREKLGEILDILHEHRIIN